MRRSGAALAFLFLFGVYALPGKVCPSSHTAAVRPATTDADLPPCHRKAANQTSQERTPCETMVCCLVPEASRGTGAAVVVPTPGASDFFVVFLENVFLPNPTPSRFYQLNAQAPPGTWFEPLPSASPRAPPTLV